MHSAVTFPLPKPTNLVVCQGDGEVRLILSVEPLREESKVFLLSYFSLKTNKEKWMLWNEISPNRWEIKDSQQLSQK